MIQTSLMENGIRVILEPIEHTGIVSIGFWQLQGSRDESDAQTGFSHFLEHMLFKGTKKRNAYQIAQQVERVGGYLNAFTEKETACFYCTIPKDHAPLAIDILSDMLFNSKLDKEDIEKEKAVIINEIKTIEDNPEEKGYELYLKDLWNRHTLSRRITGESENIKRISRSDLLDFYNERFIPSSIIVTVSGNFDHDLITEQLKLINSNHSKAAHSERIPPTKHPAWKLVKDKFQQVHVFTGTSFTPTPYVNDFYKDLIFSTLFGESMSSRLFQRIREKDGLCYAIYSFRSYYTDTACWTIYANTVPEFVPRLLSSINEELNNIISTPPAEQEIDDVKGQIKGNMVLAREDIESRMKRLLRQYMLTGRVIDFEDSLKILAEITLDDVVSVIQKLIVPKEFNLLAYGSKKLKRLKCSEFNF